MESTLFMDGVRGFFSIVDKVVYSLIGIVYNLMLELANVSIFTNEDIMTFSTRIYTFIGVVMLFKVTFSLITYLVNPDSINDKTAGAGNLAKNIVITLFLIIIVPFGFDLLYRAQAAILNDNLIPKLILGTESDGNDGLTLSIDPNLCGDTTSLISDNGTYISLVAFRPFYQIYDDIGTSDINSIVNSYCTAPSVSYLLKAKFWNADEGAWHYNNSGSYIIDYSFFMSTATGIIILLLLLGFCMDIAVRCIKLGFLEIFSPIPIISYVDPKSGKDGMFKKWLKEVISTWASLFIRLVTIFFVVFIIQTINKNLENYAHNGLWVMLFLIIGALMFAKQAPKLLEDIAGVKLGGSFNLNPLKKVSNEALGGKALVQLPGRAAGTMLGTGIAVGSNIIANRKKSKDFETKRNDAMNAQQAMYAARAQYKKDRLARETFEKNARGYDGTMNEWDNEHLNTLRNAELKSKQDANEAKINAKNLTATAQEQKSKNDVFSYDHQLISTLLQAFRGGYGGFTDQDAAKLSKAISVGINAAKKATKQRNDYDKFGLIDRLKDLGSDLTGVKNESGTTSEVKKAMKEQTESLNDIRNAISSLEHSFGNFKPGAIAYDNKGKMSINMTGTYSYAPGEKESIEGLISEYEELRKSERDTSKQLQEFDDLLSINSKK